MSATESAATADDAVSHADRPRGDRPGGDLGTGDDLTHGGNADAATPGGVLTRRGPRPFEVHLEVFSGPFDLLLGLIAKHKLDITEVALAQVTDEFIAHLRAMQAAAGSDHDSNQDAWDLGQVSEFLLVASTLLDLKAARLLPQTGDEEDEDLELIEARDLLFARLLQYRAFKRVASFLEERMTTLGRITPRQPGIDPRFEALLPDLVIAVSPEQFARIAERAMTPKEPPTVGLTHLHQAQVSVRDQADLLVPRLRDHGHCTFADLIRDADSTLVIVARFLALLELFKEAAIAFEQPEALGRLEVRWTGRASGGVDVSNEFDEGSTDGNATAREADDE